MSKSKSKKATNGSNGTEKKARTQPYPYEAFVKNWSKAQSVAEVVTMTGLSKNTVSAISTKLRKAGVPLKQMPRRSARPIDVKALSALVKSAAA